MQNHLIEMSIIKNQEKHNYHINDNLLGEGTPKEKKKEILRQ